MNRFFSVVILAAGMVFAAGPEQARAAMVSIVSQQRSIDGKLAHIWPDEPFFVLGTTHGVYLQGYGAVFTAEVNLATAPVSPLMPVPTQEMINNHHQKKMARVPELERVMRELLVQTAASMSTLSDTDNVVIAVSLTSYSWEPTGLPSQIIMQAPKGALMNAKGADGTQLASLIKSEVF